MRTSSYAACTVAALLLMPACASQRVAVPPAIDLSGFEVLGLISFECNEEGTLDEYASQQFLQAILSDQPGVRVVELGSLQEVLTKLGRDSLDRDAVMQLGRQERVSTLIVGDLTVEAVTPRVRISSVLTSLSVRAEVEARLQARLVDTESGGTVWTNSRRAKQNVGEVTAHGSGAIFFDADDPDEAYGDLVESLVWGMTGDFRVTWQKVRKQ